MAFQLWPRRNPVSGSHRSCGVSLPSRHDPGRFGGYDLSLSAPLRTGTKLIEPSTCSLRPHPGRGRTGFTFVPWPSPRSRKRPSISKRSSTTPWGWCASRQPNWRGCPTPNSRWSTRATALRSPTPTSPATASSPMASPHWASPWSAKKAAAPPTPSARPGRGCGWSIRSTARDPLSACAPATRSTWPSLKATATIGTPSSASSPSPTSTASTSVAAASAPGRRASTTQPGRPAPSAPTRTSPHHTACSSAGTNPARSTTSWPAPSTPRRCACGPPVGPPNSASSPRARPTCTPAPRATSNGTAPLATLSSGRRASPCATSSRAAR